MMGPAMASLREQLSASYPQPFQAILSVARCTDMLAFGDLWWEPVDPDFLQRLDENRDPGVMFETPRRVVVLEVHAGELRYYAAGWRSDERRIIHEQDRIEAEGSEMGVFPSLDAAIRFAERYLVGMERIQNIDLPRQPRYRQDTDEAALARFPQSAFRAEQGENSTP